MIAAAAVANKSGRCDSLDTIHNMVVTVVADESGWYVISFTRRRDAVRGRRPCCCCGSTTTLARYCAPKMRDAGPYGLDLEQERLTITYTNYHKN